MVKRTPQPACAGRKAGSSLGFTLVELMVVMLIIGVLAAIAIPSYISSIRSAREAVMREDLHVMRQAIDSYTMDKAKGPDSLDDLVQAGYLKEIPIDPMTQSRDSWITDTDDTIPGVDDTQGGISNVHSGATGAGNDDKPYSEW